jgi:hypothetical protein
MEELATDFYVGLIGTPQPREFDLNLGRIGLSLVDLRELEAQFSVDEVWAAVKAMSANKSPGPNGLSWEFFKACWAVVSVDVLAAVQAIFLGHN